MAEDTKYLDNAGVRHLLEKIGSTFVTKDEFNYKAISITSFTNDKNTVEMGSTVDTVNLKWSLNKKATALTLDGSAVTATDTSRALTGLGLKSNKTWTLKATDEKGASSSKTTSITFLNGVYYGVGAVPNAYDSSFVLNLTKALQSSRNKIFTLNAGAGEFIFYAIPARYGECGFNVGGFDGGFTKVATFDFTNASGYTESYCVYKSDNANLGNTTVTAK